MNQEKDGEKDKRKILVEFDVPDGFLNFSDRDFKIKFLFMATKLNETFNGVSAKMLGSARIVSDVTDSRTTENALDTIP